VGDYPGLETDLVVGHYKPINSPRFVNDCHEYIFHLTHSGDVPLDRLAVGVPYRDKSNVSRWNGGGRDVHCRGNTWFLPYPTILRRDRDRPHPASFPPSLPDRCLRLHGLDRTRLALDPFMGIGGTAVACAQLGIPCVGFEIDPEYRQQALARTCAILPPAAP
jgi:site-specific DNA-methyltransferase (adenine-specific)